MCGFAAHRVRCGHSGVHETGVVMRGGRSGRVAAVHSERVLVLRVRVVMRRRKVAAAAAAAAAVGHARAVRVVAASGHQLAHEIAICRVAAGGGGGGAIERGDGGGGGRSLIALCGGGRSSGEQIVR